MALDGSKNVFCAVKDWGIGYFDGKDFQLIDIKNFSKKAIKKMEFTLNGELLVLFENNELYALTVETKNNGNKNISKVKLVSNEVKTFEAISKDKICAVFKSGDAQIITLSDKQTTVIVKKNIGSIIGKIPNGLVFHNKSGYAIIDENANEVFKPWLKYLKNQNPTTLIQGSENIIWIGTDGDGVFKMYPIKKSFNLISPFLVKFQRLKFQNLMEEL